MRATLLLLGTVTIVACSASHGSGFGETTGDAASPPTGGDDSGSTSPHLDGAVPTLNGDGAAPHPTSCSASDPNADADKDGFTPAQGDCNDCDPNVNPGAIDVLSQNDGGPPTWGDEDCSGTPGDSAQACDTGLALDDAAAADGAKAIELCRTATMADKKYGVLSAAYVHADGTPFASPGLQVGIEPGFGPNVHVQGGANMLALSSGHARTVGQTGACGNISCTATASAKAPTGFPQDDPACKPTPAIADDIALELHVRAPTNATGYSFNFKFYSFEYPNYVCDPKGYNDQFVALVSPPPQGAYVPAGSPFGNISFDGNMHPVSVNLGFFDVCDPSTPQRFASACKSTSGATCPATPSPYCPSGTGELSGTGFDVWSTKDGPAGATKWLMTQAPVQGGSIVTLRFAMWDAGNALFDSTVLVDNFQWIASGAVPVSTQPPPVVK